MPDEKPDQQDLLLPEGWFAWQTMNTWHARPPGTPNPNTYVHGPTKQAICDLAWKAHRKAEAKRL